MAISLEYLVVEDAPPAAVITLNRPDQLNALSSALMTELSAELERQAARPEVRAIVIKGAGRAFSAGHDLKEMLDRSLDEEREIFAVCNKLMATVQSVPVPVIAAPHGIATAAGCQLVEVLKPEEYEKEHLPGAINLPLRSLDEEGTKMLDRNRPVIVYCWDTA